MYSVILMAALATGGEAPDCHFRHGGCHGCYGSCYGSCHGSCYGGWYGGCNGCCGGISYGYSSYSYGCCGGCCGYSSYSYGCCGGCCGGVTSYYGCCGGCTGSCYGGFGGVIAEPVYGPAVVPGPVVPSAPVMPPAKGEGASKKDDNPEVRAASRARLLVDVPVDAKLYIDDTLMKTPASRRTFATPTLDETQTYFYDVRVEVERGGKVLTETRRITLRAGDEIRTGFTEATVAAAAARAEAAVARARQAGTGETLTAARGR